jgi:hypothetical protein
MLCAARSGIVLLSCGCQRDCDEDENKLDTQPICPIGWNKIERGKKCSSLVWISVELPLTIRC